MSSNIHFIAHFNIPLKLKGKRNQFNKHHRTILYQFISFCIWLILIPLKILDILKFFYLIDFVRSLFITKRKLTSFEISQAKIVFGYTIDYHKIKIQENSTLAKWGAKYAKKIHMGFVLFRTICFSRKLEHEQNPTDMEWLVHELVHVLQFENIGVQYIIEALRAQKHGGYHYKVIDGLKSAKHLSDFNLEQQAEIAKDYYKLIKSNDVHQEIYLPFVKDIREGKF